MTDDTLGPEPAPLTFNAADNRRRRQRQKETKARLAAQREARIQREATILNMKRSGASFTEIGQALRLSRNYVHQLYNRALAESRAEGVAEYRAATMDRLSRLLQPYYGAAVSGVIPTGQPGQTERLTMQERTAAGREALRIIHEMTLTMGAHAPQQIEVDVSGTVTVTTEAVLGKLAKLKAQAEAAMDEDVQDAEVVDDPPALTA